MAIIVFTTARCVNAFEGRIYGTFITEERRNAMDRDTTEKLTDVLRQIDHTDDLQKYVDDMG